MKKYIISFLLLLVGIISVFAVSTLDDDGKVTIKKYIKVLLANGKVVEYEIQNVDSIYFENDTIYEPVIKGVELSKDTISLFVNETALLTYKVLGENVEQICSVYSENPLIASYDKSKTLVTGVAVGETTIVAIAKDGISTDTCVVIVNKEPTKDVISAIFGDDEITMEPYGEKRYLKLHLVPEDATPKTIEYTSSNNNIAAADKDEKDSLCCCVTSKGSGTTTITAIVDGEITASCKVKVGSSDVKVTSVSLSKTSLTLEPNNSEVLYCTVSPTNATNKAVEWNSDNKSVATVSSNGVVTAKADGTARITVTSVDGAYSASCTVNVKTNTPTVVKVNSVELTNKSVTIKTGSSTTLEFKINPSNATNQNVTWKSDDESVATVSSTGVVRGIKQGKTEISVTTVDGGYTDKCIVNVEYVAPYFSIISNVTVTATTASATTTLGGDITVVAEAGLQYSLDSQFGNDAILVPGNFSTKNVSYVTNISGLKEKTTYYCRSYMKLNNEANDTIYDTKIYRQFTTKSSDPFPIGTAVDLGLPSGLKWSSWNMGASDEEEIGGFYCWGDPTGEIVFPQKYSISSSADNISGNKNFDMAAAQWPQGWRMPYVSEFEELFANCTETYYKNYNNTGITVKKLTGPNGNYILLPLAGFMDGTEPKMANAQGCYWSAESYNVSTGIRNYYNLGSLRNNWPSGVSGFYRLSIRPVLGDYVPPKTAEDIEREDKEGETDKAGEAVQLGLSVRWANFNVGAVNKKPTDFGNLYAWGERMTKKEYTFDSYTLKDDITKTYTYIGDDINGTIYDVAASEWGGKWYIPTDDDWSALVNECRWEWKENYQGSGVNGYVVYGKGQYENNFIFLPAAGYKTTFSMYENTKGYYWSSSMYDNKDSSKKDFYNITAWYVSFGNDSQNFSYFDRYSGYSIRPVKK